MDKSDTDAGNKPQKADEASVEAAAAADVKPIVKQEFKGAQQSKQFPAVSPQQPQLRDPRARVHPRAYPADMAICGGFVSVTA